MVRFETEGDAREYVESNPDEVVCVDVGPLGELWFGLDDEGDFAVKRAAGPLYAAMTGNPTEPHDYDLQGDDTKLPNGDSVVVNVCSRDETPFAE